MRLAAGAGAQDQVLEKESAGGVEQSAAAGYLQLQWPGTPNHSSRKGGEEGEAVPATPAASMSCNAKRVGGHR